jgi:hypothetical protein
MGSTSNGTCGFFVIGTNIKLYFIEIGTHISVSFDTAARKANIYMYDFVMLPTSTSDTT